jgi:hypothetical protein
VSAGRCSFTPPPEAIRKTALDLAKLTLDSRVQITAPGLNHHIARLKRGIRIQLRGRRCLLIQQAPDRRMVIWMNPNPAHIAQLHPVERGSDEPAHSLGIDRQFAAEDSPGYAKGELDQILLGLAAKPTACSRDFGD